MADPLDHLEVAKLATFIGSQLKSVDQNSDGMLQSANRIDTRKFVQNVVHAANPNAYQPANIQPSVSNAEEARILEQLNNQAMGQIPDISQNSPALIPMPVPQPQPAYQQPPTPTAVPQPPQYQPWMPRPDSVPYYPPVQSDPIRDIAESVKSIDASIKALCDVFIVKAKKKKKRKTTPKQQSAPQLIQESNQPQQPTNQE